MTNTTNTTNNEIFDFFAETDFKDRLWEKMQQKVKETSTKKEISFDALGSSGAPEHKASAQSRPAETKTPDAAKKQGKIR